MCYEVYIIKRLLNLMFHDMLTYLNLMFFQLVHIIKRLTSQSHLKRKENKGNDIN